MFFETLFTDPHRFVFVVVTVVFSISLHELAHGWVATWQGDSTPRDSGHLTINPAVHMGPFSMIMLLALGMAYGLMPVDPSRFRSKHGDALVSAAGPIMNLLLAFAALTALGTWIQISGLGNEFETVRANGQKFLLYFGAINFALAILNLIPLPPLDGSSVLASFWPGYARRIRSVQDPRIFTFALIGVLILFSMSDFGFLTLGGDLAFGFLDTVFGLTFLG